MPRSVVATLHDADRPERNTCDKTMNTLWLRCARGRVNVMELRLAQLLVCNLHGGTL